MDRTKKLFVVGGLILYLTVTGISWAVFGYFGKEAKIIVPTDKNEAGKTADLYGPRDQECPINGAYFTKTEKDL